MNPEERRTLPAEVALAADASSLDPEHPTNANLRDRGIGLVPRVLGVDLEARAALLGAGAIQACFAVPLGWHAIDDGKRTLIFDAEGRMQINLDLRRCGPDEHSTLLTAIEAGLRGPGQDFASGRLELGGMQSLVVRGLRTEGEVLNQVYMVRDVGSPEHVLVGRVTAQDEFIVFAMNAAEVVMTSVQTPAAAGSK